MTRGKLFIFIAVTAVALAAGLLLGPRLLQPEREQALDIAGIYLAPDTRGLPDFQLTHHSGRPLTAADFRGHWTFVYFGYTFCPDACPLTLGKLSLMDRQLAERGLKDADTGYLLISVDPRRDTPERLAQYIRFFNDDFSGATGEPGELEKLAKPLGVYFDVPKKPNDPNNYLVDHSSAVLLIDPEARLHAIFMPPHDPATLVEDFLAIRERYRTHG